MNGFLLCVRVMYVLRVMCVCVRVSERVSERVSVRRVRERKVFGGNFLFLLPLSSLSLWTCGFFLSLDLSLSSYACAFRIVHHVQEGLSSFEAL